MIANLEIMASHHIIITYAKPALQIITYGFCVRNERSLAGSPVNIFSLGKVSSWVTKLNSRILQNI